MKPNEMCRDCGKHYLTECECPQLTGEQYRRAFLAGHVMFPVTKDQVEVFEELTWTDYVPPMTEEESKKMIQNVINKMSGKNGDQEG
jgi:hypothetical protein